MPTELHSRHGGPSMVFYSHVEKTEAIFAHFLKFISNKEYINVKY